MNFPKLPAIARTIRGLSTMTAVFVILGAPVAHAQSAPVKVVRTPELRAFWVDGFNPGFMTPQQCDDLIANLRAMHCNAVFVQVRKRGDAYYASDYEPWAADDPEHFDALAYVCRLAHERGKPYIQVHAWINACAVGGSKNPRGVAALHPEWRSVSDTGVDFDGESTKIDPAIPGAADWTYRVYMDIVRHYPVDGIHLDFIRYGGDGKTVGHWGYSPTSLARFREAMGISDPTYVPVWNDPKWQAWRRLQVTNLVKRIYLGAKSIRPKIIVSAATICWGDGPTSDAVYEAKSAAYNDVYADWRSWMRQGILDLNCPMTYVNLDKHPTFWQHWCEFVKDHQYGRMSAMGVGSWLNVIPNTLTEIEDTRTPGDNGRSAAGAVLFSYAGTNSVPAPPPTATSNPVGAAYPGAPASSTEGTEQQFNPALYESVKGPAVWSVDVPVPPMPWREHPTLGNVDGVALDPGGLAPMDQAAVTLRRRSTSHHHRYTHLTWETTADGNGFYGFPNVRPGTYDVFIDWHGHHLLENGVEVEAGRVSMAPSTVPHRPVAGTGKLKDGTTARYIGVVVTNGSGRLGDYFYIADKVGKTAVRVNAPGLVMPTVEGDLVAITGVVEHQAGPNAGPPVIDAKEVRFLGATP